MMTFTIEGPIRGGKNHMMLDPRTGRHYPSAAWAEWRNQAVGQLWEQRKCTGKLFVGPVALVVNYYPPDRRRRDATALLDALFHVLEKADIVADDSLVKRIQWTEWPISKLKSKLNTVGLSFSIARIE